MNDLPFDLPELIEFNDYGNYDNYEEALLDVYKEDLWEGGLTFNGLNVIPRVHQKFRLNGKNLDHTFVHITTQGKIEEERALDLRRCERIGWIKPIIENAHLDCVKVFVNERPNNKGKSIPSVVLWCEEVNVKIIISETRSKNRHYYTIKTFYLVNSSHKIKKLNEEYDEYVLSNGIFQVNTPI
ncbi:MAG: hypothetical protein AAGC43_13645 [Bacteroidota bacterium]